MSNYPGFCFSGLKFEYYIVATSCFKVKIGLILPGSWKKRNQIFLEYPKFCQNFVYKKTIFAIIVVSGYENKKKIFKIFSNKKVQYL